MRRRARTFLPSPYRWREFIDPLERGRLIMKRVLRHFFTLTAIGAVAVLTLSARSEQQGNGRNHNLVPLATGQFTTPTAIPDAHQQFLNPLLTDVHYKDFVAGEAVRSRLSPDGTTLAILTAGQNSLYRQDGTLDAANSTQYIFLYDVTGPNGGLPVLKQVIKQANSHVGLVFSPDGKTLYAAGGSDDAVYVYTKGAAGSFALATTLPLGHFPPGSTGNARNKGVGLSVQPYASGLDVSTDGRTLVVANN